MLVGDSGSDEDDFKPAQRDAEKSKAIAAKMLDSDDDEEEEFKPAKKEPPKKAGAIGLPQVKGKKKDDFKPLPKAGLGKPTIRKTVAFADSGSDNSDEGFAMVSMKKPEPKAKPSAKKIGAMFGDDDDSDDDDVGGFGLPKTS